MPVGRLDPSDLLPRRAGRESIVVGVVARTALDREALVRLLDGMVGLTAQDLGPGNAETVDREGELAPGVVLMDLESDAAIPFAAALRARGLGIPVLALLRTGSPGEVLALARAGVTGFLAPTAGTRALVLALRRLLAKRCTVPRALIGPVLEAVRSGTTEWRTPGGVIFGLSAREAQVARCLGLGLTDREIARALRVRPGTAKVLVHRVLRKLGAHRRAVALERLREMDRKVERLMARRPPSGERAPSG